MKQAAQHARDANYAYMQKWLPWVMKMIKRAAERGHGSVDLYFPSGASFHLCRLLNDPIHGFQATPTVGRMGYGFDGVRIIWSKHDEM